MREINFVVIRIVITQKTNRDLLKLYDLLFSPYPQNETLTWNKYTNLTRYADWIAENTKINDKIATQFAWFEMGTGTN